MYVMLKEGFRHKLAKNKNRDHKISWKKKSLARGRKPSRPKLLKVAKKGKERKTTLVHKGG